MGEVYKARDNRLNRLVAIRVLRADLVAAPSHKLRFLQEAKSASALNHPNIVRIYDIFEHEGLNCMIGKRGSRFRMLLDIRWSLPAKIFLA